MLLKTGSVVTRIPDVTIAGSARVDPVRRKLRLVANADLLCPATGEAIGLLVYPGDLGNRDGKLFLRRAALDLINHR